MMLDKIIQNLDQRIGILEEDQKILSTIHAKKREENVDGEEDVKVQSLKADK